MFTLSISPHSMATPAFIKQVIAIKNIAWPHSEESQLAWIEVSLKPEDLHCILLKNEQPVGYVNLVNEQLTKEDGSLVWIWGIGNVCVIKKGEGYGVALMKKTNEFIILTKRIGLLLCRNSLVRFYEKCGWKVNQNLMELHDGIFAMTYNFDNEVNYKYRGRFF